MGLGSRSEDLVEVQVDDGHPFGDFERDEDLRRDLADGAEGIVARLERGRSGGVQAGGHLGLIETRAGLERRGELPPHRNGRGRIGAGEHDGECFVLAGQLSLTGRIDVADLEQRDAGPAVRLVVRDRPEQTRPE